MWSIWIPQVAAFLSALAVSYGAKRGFTLDPVATTATFVGIFTTVLAVANKYFNPGNVAAPELVDPPKSEVRAVRRAGGKR